MKSIAVFSNREGVGKTSSSTTSPDVREARPAQEARKPMFVLKPADGAIGDYTNAVQRCYCDFRALARTAVARRCGVTSA